MVDNSVRNETYFHQLGTSREESQRIIYVFNDLHGAYYVESLRLFDELLRTSMSVLQ